MADHFDDPVHGSETPDVPSVTREVMDTIPVVTIWPKVIGIISICYAVSGMTCASLGTAWGMVATSFIPGFEWEMPPAMTAMMVGGLVSSLLLGIYMLMGAIALLRRRRSGPTRLSRWAILRVLVLVLWLAGSVATLNHNVAMQLAIQDATNQMILDADPNATLQTRTEEEISKTQMISTVVITGIIAIYPTFIVMFLGRRKIKDEVDAWDA